MQTKMKALTGTVAMLVIASVLFAYPAFAAQATTSTTTASSGLTSTANKTTPVHKCNGDGLCGRPDLKVGSVITYTTQSGTYWPPGHRDQNASASVSLEYTVTGVFNQGYSLTLTAGSVTLGDKTYALSSGSAELGPHGGHMIGQATGQDGLQLILHINNLGNFGKNNYATIGIDLNNGSAQYYLRAMTTFTVANPAVA